MKTLPRLFVPALFASSLVTAAALAQAPTPATPSPAPAPAGDTPASAKTAAPTLAAGLDVSQMATNIKGETFESRDKLLQDIRSRMEVADRGVAALRTQAHPTEQFAKDRWAAAQSEYDQRKAALEKNLEAARSADANAWERIRLSLAADYAFYTAGVANMEVASH